jgi:hypothetical protein
MPNEKSSPGFRGAGYQFPGERRLFVWSPEPRKLMGGGGGGLGSAALGILSKPLLSRRPSRAKGLKTCEVERLNADAEELSLCFCREWDGILQDRDASWLGWRFGDGMGVPYRFLASCDDEGKTLAWAVVTKELRESREVGYILDLVARDPRAGKAVVAEALGVLAGWGVDLVMSAVCGRGLGALMVRAGMVPVPKALAPKRFFLAYRTAPGAGAEFVRTLRSPQSWYITLADWDAL